MQLPGKWPKALLTLAMSLAAVGGCQSASAPSEIPPNLVGTIEEVYARDGRLSVRVSNLEVPHSHYNVIVLHVRQPGLAPPIYLRRVDGELELAGVGALQGGVRLRAATTGVEMRSDPPQWTATRVVVDLYPR